MARLAVGVVGAAVGFYLGGPAGASIGWSLGAAAGGFLFPESGPNVEGARLDDLRVMGSSYGVPIPIVAGAMRVPGQVIWAANLREIRTEEDVGGKGGPSATQVSYSYTGTFAVALCEGPIAAVTRVWANGQCVYDVRDPGNTEALVASGNWVAVSGMRIYLGTESQLPDPAIEAAQGVGTTPAFRGLAYVVFENLPLDSYGNALPRQLDFEVVTGVGADTPQRVLFTPATLGRTYAAPWIAQLAPGVVGVIEGTAPLAELRSTWDGAAAGYESTTAPVPVASGVTGLVFAGFGPDARPVFTAPGVVDTLSVGAVQGQLRAGSDTTVNLLSTLIPGRKVFGVALGDQAPVAVVLHGGAAALAADAWVAVDLASGAAVGSGSIDPALSTTVAIGIARYGHSLSSPTSLHARCLEGADWRVQWVASATNTFTVECQVIGTDNVLRRLAYFTYGGFETQQQYWGLYELGTNRPLAIAAADGVAVVAAHNGLWVWRRITGSAITAPTLQAVVTGLCTRAGLSAGQIDVSLLSGTVDGVAYTRGGSGRSLLDSLRAAYWFDAVESGDKIRFVPRGGAPVAALTLDDLAAADDGAAIASEREHDDALPERVAVAYAARDSDYRVGSQLAVRGSLAADSLRTVELPLALSDARAAQVAQVALADAWMGRTARRLTLMPRWAALEPTDVIDLTDATRTARLRVVRKSEVLAEGVRLECVDEDAALYSPSATAGAVAGTGNSPALAGPTRLEVLDLPPLRDADDNAGYYAALAGYTSAWPGGVLFDSADGVAFTQVAASGRGAVIGAALTALPDFGGGNVFDEASVLEVSVPPTVTLASVTRAQALGGANAALVGSEVIAFRAATLVSAGRYTLTGLLRGRVGTEWAIAGHAAGERFVLLTTSLADVPADLAVVGGARTLKAATVGTRVDDAAPRPFTPAGARLKPFAPAHLQAVRLGNDIRLRWRRANRLGYAWRDFGDAPLSEATERYDVEVYDATWATVKRTFSDVAATEVDYTLAMQLADFGLVQQEVRAIAYQRSAAVGRGWPARALLTPTALALVARNWDDGLITSQTLFAPSGGSHSVAAGRCRLLPNAGAYFISRLDFVPSILAMDLTIDVVRPSNDSALVLFGTTYWTGVDQTYGYVVYVDTVNVGLGRGSNNGTPGYAGLGTWAHGAAAGAVLTLRVTRTLAGAMTVYVNGTSRITTTDTTHGAGQVALAARGTGGAGSYEFDNLQVTY